MGDTSSGARCGDYRGSDRSERRGVPIASVARGSIGDELGLRPGDRLVKVNGRNVRDLLEYSYLTHVKSVSLVVTRDPDQEIVCEIEKDEDEDLGLSFDETLFDGMMRCRNNCVFCFVRQNPHGVRRSLCVRDDDPRLSFLHGNYVSLTNLSDDHFDLLLQMRLSPMYVSVHSTDPELRQRMMGYKRRVDIMAQLSALARAGVVVHCQIVLCPGINDGPELVRTVRDLSTLYPQIRSVAVVPVGLTSHRAGLPALLRPSTSDARAVLDAVLRLQQSMLESNGTRFVFASDELFLLAKRPIPSGSEYENYQQIENGVGLTRMMADRFRALLSEQGLPMGCDRSLHVLTGVLGAQALEIVLVALPAGLRRLVRLLPITNSFFGDPVTVTGLLSGHDVLRGVEEIRSCHSEYHDAEVTAVIPDVVLNGDGLFVDDLSVGEVVDRAAELGVDLRVVSSGAEGLYTALTAMTKRGMRSE